MMEATTNGTLPPIAERPSSPKRKTPHMEEGGEDGWTEIGAKKGKKSRNKGVTPSPQSKPKRTKAFNATQLQNASKQVSQDIEEEDSQKNKKNEGDISKKTKLPNTRNKNDANPTGFTNAKELLQRERDAEAKSKIAPSDDKNSKEPVKSNSWDKPLTQRTIPSIMRSDDKRAVEIGFDLKNVDPKNPLPDQGEKIRHVLKQILNRGRTIAGNKKFGIEPFFAEKGKLMNLGTIFTTDDIPPAKEFEKLRTYFTHEDEKPGTQRKWLINGKNSRWKIRIALRGISWKKYLHMHEMSRNDNSVKSEFVFMKSATSQGDYSWCLGYLNNSSEKQLTDKIEADLTKEMKMPITIEFRNIPAHYDTVDKKWKEAKENSDKRIMYRCAPMAMVVYTDEKQGAERMKAVETLNNKYGKQNKNGQYPRFSDGSRMRFVPSFQYLSILERERTNPLINVHIHLKKSSLEYPLEVSEKNLQHMFPKYKKTLGEILLGIQDK